MTGTPPFEMSKILLNPLFVSRKLSTIPLLFVSGMPNSVVSYNPSLSASKSIELGTPSPSESRFGLFTGLPPLITNP